MNRSSLLYGCVTISHPQYHHCFFVKSHSTLYHQHLQTYPILNTPIVFFFGKYPSIKHDKHLQCINVQTADWSSNAGGCGELLLCDKTSKWKATITIYKTTVFSYGQMHIF